MDVDCNRRLTERGVAAVLRACPLREVSQTAVADLLAGVSSTLLMLTHDAGMPPARREALRAYARVHRVASHVHCVDSWDGLLPPPPLRTALANRRRRADKAIELASKRNNGSAANVRNALNEYDGLDGDPRYVFEPHAPLRWTGQVAPFVEATRGTVELHGLRRRRDLNGSRGRVRLFDASTGRYDVALEDSQGRVINTIAVHEENLRFSQAQDDAFSDNMAINFLSHHAAVALLLR